MSECEVVGWVSHVGHHERPQELKELNMGDDYDPTPSGLRRAVETRTRLSRAIGSGRRRSRELTDSGHGMFAQDQFSAIIDTVGQLRSPPTDPMEARRESEERL